MPIEAILFAFLLCAALAVVHLTDLFGAAMVFAVFSLLSAGMFTLMDAVDVAFTEAAVGAGISTVLMLSTLSLTTETENQRGWKRGPLLVVLLTGAALTYGTLDMPVYGDPNAVIHHYVVPQYFAGAVDDFQIPNIVTIVLASYRGYDTLGETFVVFTATAGVLALLGVSDRDSRAHERPTMTPSDGKLRMRDYPILRVVSTRLIPFILLYALYVQFHGDFGPGGGFQAGVIFAAGMILYGLIFGLTPLQQVIPHRIAQIGLASGVLIYAGTGLASLPLGAHLLDYAVLDAHDPVHGRHLGILLVEAGVGITVTCAMLLIFYSFAERRRAREGP